MEEELDAVLKKLKAEKLKYILIIQQCITKQEQNTLKK